MTLRTRRAYLVAVLAGATTLSGATAYAQAKDTAATKLADDALMNEYLAMDFEGAIAKLQKALALCGADKCSPAVVARLHRDLGVVYLAGLNDAAKGKAEFAAAVAADPAIELDPDLATEAVTQAFNEAKSGAGAGPAEGEQGGVGDIAAIAGGESAAADAEVPTSGDLLHVPPPEQAVLTPLPLYVELASGADVDSIRIRYLPPTMRDWLVVNVPEMGMGYGVLISCTDVGSTPGEFKYFIEGVKDGKVVAFSGNKEAPHRVAIKSQIEGEPPSLPGEEPPAPCDYEACPPGLPGCGEDVGGECGTDEDCSAGLVCVDGLCEEPKVEVKVKHHWISVGFQQDLLGFAKTPQVCAGGGRFACFFAGNAEYRAIPDPGNGNAIDKGGFGLATQRVLVGYEYQLKNGLAVGLRVGFAFGGAPASAGHEFMPIHGEGRLGYAKRIGKSPLMPYGFLTGGMMEVDGRQMVSLTQTSDQCLRPDGSLAGGECPPPPEEAPNQDMGDTLPRFTEASTVDAWKWAGNGFFGGGLGTRILFTGGFGLYLESRMAYAFPTAAPVIGLQGGLAFGF